MILKESEIDQDNITPVLGLPYKEAGKLLTATGSSFYFIRELTDQQGESVLLWEDSKAIFQRYEKGLALFVNRSNYQRALLIPFDSFVHIELKEYHHTTDKGFNSPSFLRKFFSFLNGQNSRETQLRFTTNLYKGSFITSYSSFNKELEYFRKLGLSDILSVKKADK